MAVPDGFYKAVRRRCLLDFFSNLLTERGDELVEDCSAGWIFPDPRVEKILPFNVFRQGACLTSDLYLGTVGRTGQLATAIILRNGRRGLVVARLDKSIKTLLGSEVLCRSAGIGPRHRTLTGIPQLVEIPAPVTMTIFWEVAKILAIFCSWRFSALVTAVIGIAMAGM